MPTPKDIALVVGIDDYPDHPLYSCGNDATRIAELLERNDDREDPDDATANYTVELHTQPHGNSPNATLSREAFLEMLADLLQRAADQSFLFYFSGHGATSAWGSELVLGDELGVSMGELLHLFQTSRCREIVVILDCCFSGSYGVQPDEGGDGFAPTSSSIRDGLVLLAASRTNETAWGGSPDGYSAFTELVILGLEGGAANYLGQITALSLFEYVAPALRTVDQQPVFKANLSTPSRVVRTVSEPTRLGVLRRATDLFDEPTTELVLVSSDVEGTQRFDDLLAFRAAGLLVCPDDRSLADHAASGSTVRLSPAGVQIWTLVDRDMI